MSDKATDEKNTVAVGAKGVVLPPQRKGLLRRRPSRRLVIIALGIVVVLAGVGTAAWLWSQRDVQPDTQESTEEIPEMAPQYGGEYNVSEEAVRLINTGDVDGGLALYDAAIEQAADDDQRRAGLLMEASEVVRVAIAQGTVTDRQYLQRSLDYALLAEPLLQNLQSASQVWIVYRDMGNEAEAAKYEQLMMERDTSPGLENQ